MAEQTKKPSIAKKTKLRASRSNKTSTTQSKNASTTRRKSNPSAARSGSKKPATSSLQANVKARAAKSAPEGPADMPSVSKAQIEEQTKRFRRKADKYRNDPKKTEKLLKDAESKSHMNPGPISGQLQDLATLLRLVRAYFSKEYREMPWETVALAIGAIAYFVSPVDLIPDFIPVAGYVDDAAVIAFVLASATNDLHNFREWEAQQQLGT